MEYKKYKNRIYISDEAKEKLKEMKQHSGYTMQEIVSKLIMEVKVGINER